MNFVNNLQDHTIIYCTLLYPCRPCLKSCPSEHIPTKLHTIFPTLCSNSAMSMHRCQRGLKQMRDVLLFFADFSLTFSTLTLFDVLRNQNKGTSIDAKSHFCANWCYIVPLRSVIVLTIWSLPGLQTVIWALCLCFCTVDAHRISSWRRTLSRFLVFFEIKPEMQDIPQNWRKEDQMKECPHGCGTVDPYAHVTCCILSLASDVPIHPGQDLGQHWHGVRPLRHGARQLHQGWCQRGVLAWGWGVRVGGGSWDVGVEIGRSSHWDFGTIEVYCFVSEYNRIYSPTTLFLYLQPGFFFYNSVSLSTAMFFFNIQPGFFTFNQYSLPSTNILHLQQRLFITRLPLIVIVLLYRGVWQEAWVLSRLRPWRTRLSLSPRPTFSLCRARSLVGCAEYVSNQYSVLPFTLYVILISRYSICHSLYIRQWHKVILPPSTQRTLMLCKKCCLTDVSLYRWCQLDCFDHVIMIIIRWNGIVHCEFSAIHNST